MDSYTQRLHHLGLSEIKFDDLIYAKANEGMDYMSLGGPLPYANTPFHQPIHYVLSKDAYLFAQILLGTEEIDEIDYIKIHRLERQDRENQP